MQPGDYHRFHNFLAAHDCKVDFRAFRTSMIAATPATAGLQNAS
jgi:hypothetical protein